MKTCNDIQTALRDRFDLGEDLAGFADDHVTACAACGAYRSDLAQLAGELGVFEIEGAPEDLSARIIQHVRKHGFDHGLRVGDYVSIAMVVGAASIGAGWYMPAWVDPSAWWSQASAWLAHANSMFSVAPFFDRSAALRSVFDNAFSGVPVMSQPVVWTALAVSCVGAVAFNGYMAMRMRTAGD